jgi:hypothetical protein
VLPGSPSRRYPGLFCSVRPPTAQLVQGEVRLGACPAIPRLGPTAPSPAYQVLGLGSPLPTSQLPDGARPRSRFVWRELELATLQALRTRVAGGQGQVVGIVGEPGMGKTRLLTEFGQRLEDTRVTALAGHTACRMGRRPPINPSRTSCGTPVAAPRQTAQPRSPRTCSNISERSEWLPLRRRHSFYTCSAYPTTRQRLSGAALRRSAPRPLPPCTSGCGTRVSGSRSW